MTDFILDDELAGNLVLDVNAILRNLLMSTMSISPRSGEISNINFSNIFQGWLNFNGARVSMQYSVPRDQRAFEQPKVLSDWICAKVGLEMRCDILMS